MTLRYGEGTPHLSPPPFYNVALGSQKKKTQFELFKKFATVKPVVLICLTDADHRSKIITTVEIDYQDWNGPCVTTTKRLLNELQLSRQLQSKHWDGLDLF